MHPKFDLINVIGSKLRRQILNTAAALIVISIVFSFETFAQMTDVVVDKHMLFRQGLGLVIEEKYREAAGKFEEVAKIDPFYRDVHTNLSHMYILLGMYEQAERAAVSELKNFPESAMAYNNWGYALLRQGKYDEAILQLRRAIFFGINDSVAYINLINAYSITQHTAQAIDISEETIQKFPKLLEVYQKLTLLYLVRNEAPKALAIARKYKENNPDSDAGMLLEIEVLGFARRFSEMSDLIDKALAADPNNVNNLEKFAKLYQLAQQHTKSIDLFRKVLVLQPESYNAAFSIGMGYSDLKRYTVSNTALEIALKLNPKSSQSLMLMAHNFLSLKNRSAAQRCYEKLKEFDAESAEIVLETIKNHR